MPIPFELIYTKVGRLLEAIPQIYDYEQAGQPEMIQWLSKAEACIKALDDATLHKRFRERRRLLANYNQTAESAREILQILFDTLENLEFELPAGISGTFIPVGSRFDAYTQIRRILLSASEDVLIIDPYMDESVLTDFFAAQPETVLLRLLTVDRTNSAIKGAAHNWTQQYGQSRPLELRFAARKQLHDRLILIDKKDAWTVIQSFKDLAVRSPGERTDARCCIAESRGV